MPLSADDFAEFEFHLNSDGHRERECARFLHGATDLLIGQTPVRRISIGFEDRNPYGQSDYIVIAELTNEATGVIERQMIFWELKSPQCVLMESDDNRVRFRPSRDMVKAETQLIHYCAQAQDDADLRDRRNIRSREHVRMGGIVIGRDGVVTAQPDDREAARHSLAVRTSRIYRPAGIRIVTWDRIADALRP